MRSLGQGLAQQGNAVSGRGAEHTTPRTGAFALSFCYLVFKILFITIYILCAGISPPWAVCAWCMRWGFSCFSIPVSSRVLPGSRFHPLLASQMRLTPCGGRGRPEDAEARYSISPAPQMHTYRNACVCDRSSSALFLSDRTGHAPLRTLIPLTSCTGTGRPKPAKVAG